MQREVLVELLRLVEPAVSNRDLIPIFKCFCFDGKSVVAYDDIVALSAPCEVPFVGGVRSDILLSWLSATSGTEIKFKPTEGDVKFSCGRSHTTLPLLPKEDFLYTAPDGRGSHKLEPPESFLSALQLCVRGMGVDTNEKETMGVVVGLGGKGATLYACDSVTATRAQVAGLKGKEALGLSPRFADLLASYMVKRSLVCLRYTDSWVQAEFEGGVKLFGLLNQEAAVDEHASLFKSVGSPSVRKQLVPVPKSLSGGLSQVSALTRLTKESLATLRVRSGRLEVSASTDLGRVVAASKTDHSEAKLSANPEVLLRCLGEADQLALLDDCILLAGTRYRCIVAAKHAEE